MSDKPIVLLVAAVLLAASACSGKNNGDAPGDDTGATDMSGTGDGNGGDAATPDARSRDDATQPPEDLGMRDMGADAPENPDLAATVIDESEPNDGTTFDEIDALSTGQAARGFVDAMDSDVFGIATEPGRLYEVTIDTAGSPLVPHITVLDDGRDGDAAGGDYVKISRGTPLRFLAMGEGGYYVAVRDARNVDGGMAGGADHTYSLSVVELEPADATAGAVNFGSTFNGALDGAADVDLWTFDGTEGTFVTFDLRATGDMDARLYVFAQSTGSWIARQDDRAAGDPDPVIDAPLTASGPMYLVVENIDDQATAFGYTVEAAQ